MADKIKHYCSKCCGPITESEVLGDFAIKNGDEWTHFYHTQPAQDVLQNEEYMEAIGFYISKIKHMSKSGKITGEMAKHVCEQTAEEFNLEFDKLELGIRAFYSFTICEERKSK